MRERPLVDDFVTAMGYVGSGLVWNVIGDRDLLDRLELTYLASLLYTKPASTSPITTRDTTAVTLVQLATTFASTLSL